MKYLLFVIICPIICFSQIGLNTLNPSKNSFLHISAKSYDGSNNMVFKGIILPSLSNLDLTTFHNTLSSESSTENEGLLLFNKTDHHFTYWATGQWKRIAPSQKNASYTLSCNTANVLGSYIVNKELTTVDNSIDIDVDVTSTGNYYIQLLSSNGFYFYKEGKFTSTGIQTIRIPAYGIPIQQSTTNLTLKANGELINCNINVNITPSIATYTQRCTNIAFTGTYTNGTLMTTSNKLKLIVDVYVPGTYNIETTVANGVQFTKQGVFNTTGPNEILLDANGTVNMQKQTHILSTDSFGKINTKCLFGLPLDQ